MKEVIIIGAGGYAKSVLDSIDKAQYTIAGFIDENTNKKSHLGHPIIARSLNDKNINAKNYAFFVAIGNNEKRTKWFSKLCEKGLDIITIIGKTAIVSNGAKIGRGCFIGKTAIINNGAKIGDDCIINTKSLVEHGCNVGNHANISTNSVINGDVIVGEGSFIGSCSVTIGQIKIGEWSTVGAGAVVIRNVENCVTVAGVPAKEISKETMLG